MKPSFRISKRCLWTAACSVVLFVSGCGRALPAIDAAALANKKALLVITSGSVTDEENTKIRNTAMEIAKAQSIALEFVPKTPSLTEELSARMKAGPFDGVIAVGNELVTGTVEAAQNTPAKHFVLLGNGLDRMELPANLPGNLLVERLDDARKTAVWDDWVKRQKTAGMNVLWITRSSNPIPPSWAPSEESDRVLSLDVYSGDTWFPQLVYQTQALQAQWIALYTPLEPAQLNKLKNLRIPVLDMTAGLAVRYDWTTILKDSIGASLSKDWKGGSNGYTDQEVQLTLK